jgi:hypothetical protein
MAEKKKNAGFTPHKHTVAAHGISMNFSLTNKAAAPITSQQKKKTNQYSHSSCTWYINEYNLTNKAAAPITSRQKRKQTNIHTVATHDILYNYSWTHKAATPITSRQKRKQTRLHMVHYNKTSILTATLKIQDLQGTTQ